MSGRAYSVDLRERVLAGLDEGMSKAALSRLFRGSMRWIYKLEKQQKGDAILLAITAVGLKRPKAPGA